jgi:hypothetical protein
VAARCKTRCRHRDRTPTSQRRPASRAGRMRPQGDSASCGQQDGHRPAPRKPPWRHADRTGVAADTVGVHGAMVPGVSQPGDPLRPSRAARWTLSTEGQGLISRNLEGRVSKHKSVPVYRRRKCARRINDSTFPYGVRVIALPLFDSLKVKPPVAANAKARQVSFSEHAVNGGPMDVQIFGQFRDG